MGEAMPNQMITTAQAFYAQLRDNNTKAWWDEHRSTYDTVLKPGALALLDQLCPVLENLADCPVTPKLFRPHRDVRFSKDKTPYKDHLHMMWTTQTAAPQSPVFFYGIGVDYLTVGAGLMGFDKALLDDWRKMVDLDADRIAGIVTGVEAHGFTLREPALKRVPSPYPADHPMAHLLRMKGVVATRELVPGDDVFAALTEGFEQVSPLNDLLTSIAEG